MIKLINTRRSRAIALNNSDRFLHKLEVKLHDETKRHPKEIFVRFMDLSKIQAMDQDRKFQGFI